MRTSATLVALAFALPAALAPSIASAQEAPDEPSISVPKRHDGYWARGDNRPFLATTIDVGYLYLRPRLTLGYGKPFTTFVALDINPLVTNEGYGAYGGLRVQIPWFDLRAGARAFEAFTHEYLTPQAHYNSVDLEETTGTKSKYVTLETELSGGIPAGPGSVLLVLTASAVEAVPKGEYVYEETLRVITNPPAIFRGRTGYALRFGPEGAARVGVVGELLDLPKRGDLVFRAGVIASFAISDHLEALGLLVIPVASPDSIGIAGGDFAELGIRYRWATGQRPLGSEGLP
jgi:hypothetical protein